MIDRPHCLREILGGYYPNAIKVRLVPDNLNTQSGASLYEAIPPAKARGLGS